MPGSAAALDVDPALSSGFAPSADWMHGLHLRFVAVLAACFLEKSARHLLPAARAQQPSAAGALGRGLQQVQLWLQL